MFFMHINKFYKITIICFKDVKCYEDHKVTTEDDGRRLNEEQKREIDMGDNY